MIDSIRQIIVDGVSQVERPDLFREPLVAVSAADNPAFAQLKSLIGEWHYLPSDILPGAASVISFFVPFTREVASGPRKSQGASEVWGEAYIVINQAFVDISNAVIDYLHSQGFQAGAIPPTHTYNPEDLKCKWSHRSAAVIAGLGEIAANRLVITDKGSCGRFCTVITTAPLAPSGNPAPRRCKYLLDGSCGACFKICPVGALGPDGMDKFACQDELFRNQQFLEVNGSVTEADTCGKCLSICPFSYIE